MKLNLLQKSPTSQMFLQKKKKKDFLTTFGTLTHLILMYFSENKT